MRSARSSIRRDVSGSTGVPSIIRFITVSRSARTCRSMPAGSVLAVLIPQLSSERGVCQGPLLVLLLPLPLDIKFPLLAPYFRRAFPLELVPVNRQLVLDGELVIHELPHGGERQSTVLRLQVLELCLLLVWPAHRPGDFSPVLLDRPGVCPLLLAS